MFVYRSREIPLRFNSSLSNIATCFHVSKCPVSTKSFNQICNCCFKSVTGRNFNPCPTLVSIITSANVGKSICLSSESCSNRILHSIHHFPHSIHHIPHSIHHFPHSIHHILHYTSPCCHFVTTLLPMLPLCYHFVTNVTTLLLVCYHFVSQCYHFVTNVTTVTTCYQCYHSYHLLPLVTTLFPLVTTLLPLCYPS